MTPTNRKPAAERREDIAAAVLRIIGEQGLSSLTTASLAAEVGVSTGALFRHFASLDEILVATVHHGVRRIDATNPDASLPPIELIQQLARNRVRLLAADPGLAWLLRSEQSELNLPPEAVECLRGAIRRTRKLLLDALREGAANGSVRGDIEADVLLVLVLGTIHAVIGLPGGRTKATKSNRVLSALAVLLEPPGKPPRRVA